MTSCMMTTTVRKCQNANLHIIVFLPKRRPIHMSHVLGGIIVDKNVRRAIVPKGTAIITPHFNPSDNKANVAKSGIRKSDTSESKLLYPSSVPQLIPEYYAACHFPETMPDVVETDNPIQGMLSNAAMLSSKKKAQRLSAYEPDPITVEDCLNSKNWDSPKAGNSWKDAILK